MKLESERVHIRQSRFLQLQLPKALKAEIEKQAGDLWLCRSAGRSRRIYPTRAGGFSRWIWIVLFKTALGRP